MSWVRLTEAPSRFPGLGYRSLYEAAKDGKIRSERRGAAWWLWEADCEMWAIREAAVRRGIVTPDGFDAMASDHELMRDTVKNICTALIQVEVGYRSLKADYEEAVNKGNVTLADAIRETITTLRAAEVSWNGTSWTLEVPGVGRVTSQPVSSKAKEPA